MITYLDLSDPLIKQSQILVDFTLKKDKLDQIEEYKGVKQAIGQFHHSTPFTNHLLPVEDGDRFFLFSDGFADQFGGEKGKIFKNKTLTSFLIANNGVSMDKIKDKLNTAFYS